jgi:hypothetical protein
MRAGVTARFTAEAVVSDRTVKIRRAIAWSAEPLFEGDDAPRPPVWLRLCSSSRLARSGTRSSRIVAGIRRRSAGVG